MIDIHCHILPQLDDGPDTVQEALTMARQAVEEGVHTVIATPHHANGRHHNPAVTIQSAVVSLQQILHEQAIPLSIKTGAEIHAYPELLHDAQQKELQTLNDSRYFLLELPGRYMHHTICELIHELSLLELVPIIAHPERNATLLKHPTYLTDLIKFGALSQVTATSLLGRYGRNIRSFANELCAERKVHFIASDAHDSRRRTVHLQEAYAHIEKRWGQAYVDYMQNNTERLLRNETIERVPSFQKSVSKISRYAKWLNPRA